MSFYIYIIYSATKNSYYVGSCEDVQTRIEQHNCGRNKSTKHGIPWQLRKTEAFPTRAEATQRESFIKKMKSRKFIELVIEGLR